MRSYKRWACMLAALFNRCYACSSAPKHVCMNAALGQDGQAVHAAKQLISGTVHQVHQWLLSQLPHNNEAAVHQQLLR